MFRARRNMMKVWRIKDGRDKRLFKKDGGDAPIWFCAETALETVWDKTRLDHIQVFAGPTFEVCRGWRTGSINEPYDKFIKYCDERDVVDILIPIDLDPEWELRDV